MRPPDEKEAGKCDFSWASIYLRVVWISLGSQRCTPMEDTCQSVTSRPLKLLLVRKCRNSQPWEKSKFLVKPIWPALFLLSVSHSLALFHWGKSCFIAYFLLVHVLESPKSIPQDGDLDPEGLGQGDPNDENGIVKWGKSKSVQTQAEWSCEQLGLSVTANPQETV